MISIRASDFYYFSENAKNRLAHMCSVQVVLFADVMGRRPGEGVCRRLFSSDVPPTGAADPGRFLRAMEAELRRRDTERWNFDFQKEKPLKGRYEWMPVGQKSANDNEPKSSDVENTTPELESSAEDVVIVDEVRSSEVAGSNQQKRRKSSSAGAVAANQAKITGMFIFILNYLRFCVFCSRFCRVLICNHITSFILFEKIVQK